jgi:site-specific DNA-cytosine methylase
MKTLELFSGTKSFSKVMKAHRHFTYTIDNDPSLEPDLCGSILDIDGRVFTECAIIWASPPCQGFSVAAIGKNWNHDNTPKTDSAKLGMLLAQKTLQVIKEAQPTWWFIENPRGKLRKMPFMEGLTRHTVSYCQYGDSRMKPTDIWTNATWWNPRKMCKNGDKCHEAAPRGSKTGTQGIDGAKDRGRIPPQLFEEILEQMPK